MAFPPVVTSSADPQIEGQGSFVVGTQADFFFTFTDASGDLFNPSDINIEIYDPDSVSVKSITGAAQLALGIYSA